MPTQGVHDSRPPAPTSTDARRLAHDLRVAELVHRSMIPRNQQRGEISVACHFQPSIGIGGDYASVHFQDDRHVVIGICDVSGHGVASALLANRVNSFVLSQAPHVSHPCELVEGLNDFVFTTFYETGLYVTFFSLMLDLEQETVVGAGCGHPPVLHYVEQLRTIRRLESDNPPVGLFANLLQPCSMLRTPFRPGDRLLLYTDGVTESSGPDGSELGIDGLERYVRESVHLALDESVETIQQRVEQFRGEIQADDDQLLLAIARVASEG